MLFRSPAADLYHVVVVPMHGLPECFTYESKDLLVEALKSLHGKRIGCYIFKGERWNISLPPRRLLNPSGLVEADLTEPQSTEADPNGLMFDEANVFDSDEYFKD